jgi:hypothetical protein
MIELGPCAEYEMVVEFLRAEIDSARFGPHIKAALTQAQLNRTQLIDQADLTNITDNQNRTKILKQFRGYTDNKYLFTGFPNDVQWRRVGLTSGEIGKLKYANHDIWVKLSGGTRIVSDGVANIEKITTNEDANKNILAVAHRVRQGDKFPPLIVVQADDDRLVIVEGHTRATAYALVQPSWLIETIVGTSPLMKQWAFY